MSPVQFYDVTPVLPVRAVIEAAEYYTAMLGFDLIFYDNPEAPKYAGIARHGVRLHLQWHDPASFSEHVDTVMLRIHVDDVQALFAEYSAKAVFHAGTALREMPWGSREFAFYDIDGNGLVFYETL